MHQQDEDDLVTCSDCGAEIGLRRDRGYRVGPAEVLCFECALAQGGVYDEASGEWIVPPEVGDASVVAAASASAKSAGSSAHHSGEDAGFAPLDASGRDGTTPRVR